MMEEFLSTLWSGFKLAYLFGMAVGISAFFVAFIWKWMEWAPINITINIFKTDES